MNFAATICPRVAPKSPAVSTVPGRAAGDTYIATLVKLLDIGEQLKIQTIALEHARNCAAKKDWAGVQLGLAMVCASADDARKIAVAANERLSPEIDDASNVYGD